MERPVERCFGLEEHKKTATACVRVPGMNGAREQHVSTVGSTVADLLGLRDWLEAFQVTPVAMESTGVYWNPVFYVLEDVGTCVLANAAQIAHVPGRKTDVKDCVWIAQLLEHGFICARSCRPCGRPRSGVSGAPRFSGRAAGRGA